MPGVASMAEWNYDGRRSHLQARQRYEDTWECASIILEMGSAQSSRIKRNIAGDVSTRDEAEAVAMHAAETELDSRGPLS